MPVAAASRKDPESAAGRKCLLGRRTAVSELQLDLLWRSQALLAMSLSATESA